MDVANHAIDKAVELALVSVASAELLALRTNKLITRLLKRLRSCQSDASSEALIRGWFQRKASCSPIERLPFASKRICGTPSPRATARHTRREINVPRITKGRREKRRGKLVNLTEN